MVTRGDLEGSAKRGDKAETLVVVRALCLAKTPSGRKKDLILERSSNFGRDFRPGQGCSVITIVGRTVLYGHREIGRHTSPAGYGRQLREMFEAAAQAARS